MHVARIGQRLGEINLMVIHMLTHSHAARHNDGTPSRVHGMDHRAGPSMHDQNRALSYKVLEVRHCKVIVGLPRRIVDAADSALDHDRAGQQAGDAAHGTQ